MKINRDYLTRVNYTDCNDLSRIEYIVVHYSGCLSDARNLGIYWRDTFAGASSHYGVGYEGDMYQYVEDEDIAWHCGGTTSYKHPKCRNSNSIGIEMMVRKRSTRTMNATDKDWYFTDATIAATIDLVKMLMKKYHIPADHVIRHYDVTGKICPNPFVYDTGVMTWAKFKAAISEAEIQNEEKTEQRHQGNASLIWYSLDTLGLTDIAKAAILGNLDAESGLRPNNIEDRYEKLFSDEAYTKAVDDGSYGKERFIYDSVGYGLAQWTFWSRKKDMYEQIVGMFGKSIGDINGQIAFLINELMNTFPSMLDKLEKCKTIREASDLVLREFEAPAVQSEYEMKKRAALAEQYYNKFSEEISKDVFNPVFMVRVSITDLNIRTGPGINLEASGLYTGRGIFTIVDTSSGNGSKNGWGLLKSYQKNRNGWISLDYAEVLM